MFKGGVTFNSNFDVGSSTVNANGFPNSTNNDPNNYIVRSIESLIAGNSGLHLFGDHATNGRDFGIQVGIGHTSSSFASSVGSLRLQPFGGTLNIGAATIIDGGTNSLLRVISDDGGVSRLEMRGDSQGSAILFVGQGFNFGGGFAFNGDDNPDLPYPQDRFVMFRRNATAEEDDITVMDMNPLNGHVAFESVVLTNGAQGSQNNAFTRRDFVEDNFANRTGPNRTVILQSPTSSSWGLIGQLRSGSTDVNGYLGFELHVDTDQGQVREPGITKGFVFQRNGVFHGNAVRIPGDSAVNSTQEVAIRVYQDGDVISVYAYANDFAASALTLHSTSFVYDPEIVDQAVVNVDLTTEPSGTVIFDSSTEASDLIAGSLPVGVPIPMPTSVVPAGYLECRGQTFDPNAFPQLAALYTNNRLPDLRGEFIRGWDNGRNVDSGRALLSAQGDAMRNLTGTINDAIRGNSGGSVASANGVFAVGPTGGGIPDNFNSAGRDGFNMDASRQVPTADEFRPRNVAFNYMVRAV